MVPLDIPQIVIEVIGLSIDTELACDRMPHAEDPVTALQKGNKAEGAHNIAGKRGRLPEAEPQGRKHWNENRCFGAG